MSKVKTNILNYDNNFNIMIGQQNGSQVFKLCNKENEYLRFQVDNMFIFFDDFKHHITEHLVIPYYLKKHEDSLSTEHKTTLEELPSVMIDGFVEGCRVGLKDTKDTMTVIYKNHSIKDGKLNCIVVGLYNNEVYMHCNTYTLFNDKAF